VTALALGLHFEAGHIVSFPGLSPNGFYFADVPVADQTPLSCLTIPEKFGGLARAKQKPHGTNPLWLPGRFGCPMTVLRCLTGEDD
jgi:hypothetical protein